jgi:hypothetical protein
MLTLLQTGRVRAADRGAIRLVATSPASALTGCPNVGGVRYFFPAPSPEAEQHAKSSASGAKWRCEGQDVDDRDGGVGLAERHLIFESTSRPVFAVIACWLWSLSRKRLGYRHSG